MRTLVLVMIAAALGAGCSKKSSEEAAAAPSASVAAPAPSVAAAAPSDSVPPLASAAPSAAPPTEEAYEKKAQTAISSTSTAEAELKKLEQEIGQ